MLNDTAIKFCLIFLALTFPVFAQNSTEIDAKIKNSVENRDYQAAVGELDNLEKSDRKIFELNNYDYLLARTAEKSGDFATAMASYQAVVNRNSVLSEYALWHLSQIARSSGNLMLERIYLQRLLALAPVSLLVEVANSRMARSYFESKDFAAAMRILSSQSAGNSTSGEQITKDKGERIKDEIKSSKARENLALLGQACLQSGKTDEARDAFTKLINNLPNPAQPDDFALAAAKALDEMDDGRENFGKIAPQLTDSEHFRRGSIYQFNRNFSLARLHFRAIVERYPASNFVADALYQTGRGFAQESDFNEAINWFERILAEFPQDPVARDALSQAASVYARAGKPKVAVARYQTFIEKYPDADNLERAYLNIIDVLRDQGENANSLKWAAKTQEVFKGKLPEVLALFAQARIRISASDWQNALADLNNLQNFSDLGGTRVPGGTNKAEVAFLKGLVLENLSRFDESIDVYLSIPDGRNEYYGWRATERLKFLAASEKANQAILQRLNQLRYILSQAVSAANAENQKQTAQSAIRLTNDARIQNQLLETIRKTYAILPNYKQIPNGKLLEFGRKEILKEKREVKNQNYHRSLADELLFLGLYDEGTPEIEAGEKEKKKGGEEEKAGNDEQRTNDKEQRIKDETQKSVDFDYTLAVFYRRGDMANRSVAFAEPLWRNIPADYQIELIPRDQIELLYPAPYVDALLKYSPERSVDARFILAIMRQESRYRADVKSNAAARGLMQFISTTADKLAGELQRDNFKQDELYNPPTAILFGSQYLANLFKVFPAQPQAVAAGYNGGEDNMLRWLKRANTSDADRYVPEIVFTQSKDYVYKVMANYRVYQMFYDEKLKK